MGVRHATVDQRPKPKASKNIYNHEVYLFFFRKPKKKRQIPNFIIFVMSIKKHNWDECDVCGVCLVYKEEEVGAVRDSDKTQTPMCQTGKANSSTIRLEPKIYPSRYLKKYLLCLTCLHDENQRFEEWMGLKDQDQVALALQYFDQHLLTMEDMVAFTKLRNSSSYDMVNDSDRLITYLCIDENQYVFILMNYAKLYRMIMKDNQDKICEYLNELRVMYSTR